MTGQRGQGPRSGRRTCSPVPTPTWCRGSRGGTGLLRAEAGTTEVCMGSWDRRRGVCSPRSSAVFSGSNQKPGPFRKAEADVTVCGRHVHPERGAPGWLVQKGLLPPQRAPRCHHAPSPAQAGGRSPPAAPLLAVGEGPWARVPELLLVNRVCLGLSVSKMWGSSTPQCWEVAGPKNVWAPSPNLELL